MTGAVYEIGALRAIDDLLVDRSVTEFDIYVGTSAGAIVASFLANGFSPETMLQVIAGQHPEIPAIKRKYIFNFNQREFIRRGLSLPTKLLGTTVEYLRDWQNATLVDAMWTLTDALPSGFYDGMALDTYMRLALGSYGRTNCFTELQRELYIIATSLDTGERAVFGTDINSDVPISTAVAASSALPMIYKPVRIGAAEYIDGSMPRERQPGYRHRTRRDAHRLRQPAGPLRQHPTCRFALSRFQQARFLGHCGAGGAHHPTLRAALSDQAVAAATPRGGYYPGGAAL